MHAEHTIDNFMELGWHILDTSRDEAAFVQWKTRALEYLTALLGPDHVYCVRLRGIIGETGTYGLLAGIGILAAAGQELTKDVPASPWQPQTRSPGARSVNAHRAKVIFWS